MNTQKVILLVRCEFEINAKSYNAAIFKAMDIIGESLDVGESEKLKKYQIDAVTMMEKSS